MIMKMKGTMIVKLKGPNDYEDERDLMIVKIKGPGDHQAKRDFMVIIVVMAKET